MTKSKIIYEEKGELTAKYYHKYSDDWLHYKTNIRIKEQSTNPIEITLEFNGTPPFVAPMPPERHSIKASSILDLHMKVKKWLKKYGYEFANTLFLLIRSL